MSEVYYRKWRPRRLGEVVGQEPVTKTLREAVSQGRLAHAYIFCGPRGTGKTSTARILAKAASCLSPQDGEPDNECSICRSINEGRALDLIEIDAASNRGIDDIRNLSDKVRFSPSEAKYKVYIIDEVHMLTEPAFNALLKTLEEPPEHAIFVLATTEIHKVPLTVISRCQRFDFRRIPLESMVDRLRELCRDEGVEVADEALTLISRGSTGSLRDAENLLEQAVVSYGSPITEEQVRDLLDLGSDQMALELVGHIVNRSIGDGLDVIDQVSGQGHDLRQLQRATMEFLRGLLHLKSGTGASLGYPAESMTLLSSWAESISIERLAHSLRTFAKVDLRRDSSTPLPLELALVESSSEVATQTATATPPIATATSRSEPRTEAVADPAAQRPRQRVPDRGPAPPPTRTAPNREPAPPPTRTAPNREPDAATGAVAAAMEGPAATLETQWDTIVRSLRHAGKRFKLGALLRGCRERNVTDSLIILKFPFISHVERMEQELDDPATRRELQEVFDRVMGDTYEVQVSLADANNDGPRLGPAQRSHLVRAAQAKGARVVAEKEDDSHHEQEDATPGTAATAAHDEVAGGA